MIGINELVLIISAMCNLRASNISRDYKEDCMEHYTNCMVKSEGKIELKNLPACRTRWENKNVK